MLDEMELMKFHEIMHFENLLMWYDHLESQYDISQEMDKLQKKVSLLQKLSEILHSSSIQKFRSPQTATSLVPAPTFSTYCYVKDAREGTSHQKMGQEVDVKDKMCYNCGNKGHLAENCPEPKKCSHCGKKGHLAKDCWKAS